jgi:hypothetical protein
MRRDLLETKLRLVAGMKRLEDMRGVWPEASVALDAVLEMEIRPALRHVEYLLSVAA